jgi:hypothetical protein
MPVTAGLVMGGTSLVGGLMGGRQAKKAAQAAADAAARAEAMYSGIKLPSVEEQKLLLQRFLSEGNYDPEVMEALGLGPSSMESVSVDQRATDAQAEALAGMQEIGKGGMTEADLAGARQLQRQTDSSDMARRKSILNQMAQRGTLGSGMELAAQLQSAQDSTQNQADATDKLIQQAQARALEGLSRTGTMSEQMRYQDFNEKSQKAQARDAINKFNTNNRQGINNQNIENRNTAQLRNLDLRQAISNSNTGLSNAEQQANKGLLQTNFNNTMDLTNAKAGRTMATGQAQAGIHAANAQNIGAITSGLTNTMGAVAGYMNGKATPSQQIPTNSYPTTTNVTSDYLKKFGSIA